MLIRGAAFLVMYNLPYLLPLSLLMMAGSLVACCQVRWCCIHFVCPTACQCSAGCLAAWCQWMHHRVLLLLCAEFFLEGDAQIYLVHAAFLYQLIRFVNCILCNVACVA